MHTSTISRRDFIRVSALVTAGTVAAACAQPAAPTAQPAPAGGEPAGGAQQPTTAPAAPAGPVSKYREAPMLAEQVEAGTLPPVDERLPIDPMVIAPWDRIGVYGGTWNSGLLGKTDSAWLSRTLGNDPLLRWSPDLDVAIANVAASWDVEEDGKAFVFHLRPGMKWSDGTPFTADDFVWWWENVQGNKEITPSIAAWMKVAGEEGSVAKVDDVTVKFMFPQPAGLFIMELATQAPYVPSHYMEQFHIAFNQESVEAAVAEQKLESWMALYGAMNDVWSNPDRPSLFGWMIETPITSATQVTANRNPYYWKVDPEGQQLPYIDRMVYPIVESVDVLVMKALNGEIDMTMRHVCTPANKSVFYDNQDKGGYHFFNVDTAWEGPCIIHLNLSHKDPVKRALYNTKEFRIALSHAINRQEIIDTIYVGDGKPAQVAPLPESPHYHERLEQQYLEYDPDLANGMLDELGLERDGDGMRLRTDGEPVFIDVECIAAFEPWADIMGMVLSYWRDIGVDGAVKVIDRSLFYERREAYDHDCMVWTGHDAVNCLMRPQNYMPFIVPSTFGAAWADWWNTGGEKGEEPPEPARRQQELYDQIKVTPDFEEQKALMREILDIAADQFWCMNITRYYQAYGIVKNSFYNVPERMWEWHVSNAPGQTYPEQYFIEG